MALQISNSSVNESLDSASCDVEDDSSESMRFSSDPMNSSVTMLSGGEGQFLEVAVAGRQSARPDIGISAQQRPVIKLSRLPAKSYRSRREMTGRRPSDVYGDTARALWTAGRRPLARSAAAIRAARSARSAAVASTDDAVSSTNCCWKPDSPTAAAHDSQEEASFTVDDVTPTESLNGDATCGTAATSSNEQCLTIDKFYKKPVAATEQNLVATPSTDAPAEPDVVDRSVSNADRLLVSASNGDRKRKSSRQQTAKRAKKTYGEASANRKDKLTGRKASSDWRGTLTNSRRRDGICTTTESGPENEELRQDDKVGEEDGPYPETLPVVSIDEKYASMSLAAMNVEHLTPTSINLDEATTTKPDSPASVPAAQSTTDSLASMSIRNMKSRKRAEHTIFERFISALSLQKPPTCLNNDDAVSAAASLAELNTDSVNSSEVPSDDTVKTSIKNVVLMDTENKCVEKIDQKQPETPVKEEDGDDDNSRKMSCCPHGVGDAAASDGVGGIKVEVAADDNADNCDVDDAQPTGASKEQNDIRGGSRELPELLVTSRPVRKRQPTTYIDASFYKSVKPERKVTALPAKSHHGSCLLPPDFDLSLSKPAGAARKSWKTVLDGPQRLSTKRRPGRPKKTKRENKRRKGTAFQDEVKWTIQKKLILDRPKPMKSRSRFAGKRRKLKAAPKSSSSVSTGGKLRTRSMTRTQACCRAVTDNVSPVLAAAGALPTKDGAFNEVRPTSCVISWSTKSPVDSAVVDRRDFDDSDLPVAPLKCSNQSTKSSATNDDDASSLIASSSPAPDAPTKSEISAEASTEETTLSNTAASMSTSTGGDERDVLPVDEEQPVETVPFPQDDVLPGELAAPEAPACDVMLKEDTSSETDQSATKVVADTTAISVSTRTTTNGSDTTKVDDESVEALMHLVQQLHDAVANDKQRKAKGQFTSLQ